MPANGQLVTSQPSPSSAPEPKHERKFPEPVTAKSSPSAPTKSMLPLGFSIATLQLGVEGALKRAFGKQIVKVLQVAKRDSAAAAAATITDPTARADPERLANAESALAKRVDEHLDKVRGPLEKLGGSVTVSRFSLSETKLGEGGIVELSFQGPSALGMGIQQAVKEQFVREVKEVKLIQVR